MSTEQDKNRIQHEQPATEPPSAADLNAAISTVTKAVEKLPREHQRRVLAGAGMLLGLSEPAPPASRGSSSQQAPRNGQQQPRSNRS